MTPIKTIEKYNWKFKRNSERQQETKYLIDCTEDELNTFYNHCKEMLYNNNPSTLGVYNIIELIKHQANCAGAELLVREQNNFTRYNFYKALDEFKTLNKDVIQNMLETKQVKQIPISLAVKMDNKDYADLPLDLVISACLEALGIFKNSRLTITFLANLGIWFTERELAEFKEDYDELPTVDYIEKVKERLGIKPYINIKINPKGLTFSEFRAAYNIKNSKFHEMTTEQLKVLRYKILPELKKMSDIHFNTWATLMKQIEEVCTYKGYVLSGIE